jgi:osmotically inducible lipoprotein OsmB
VFVRFMIFHPYRREVFQMKTIHKLAATTVIIAVLLSMAACAGMSTRDQNTAIGAGVGAVAGSALSDGSAVGTLGGAAVGGIIGHNVR